MPEAADVPDPLVTVVIPTYNQASYLPAAIQSVLEQDYPNVELIVVDDGSTDATPGIIAGYGDAIVHIGQPNRGAANALNAGIRAANGSLVCWLSSDDVFLPGKLRRQVDAFREEPDLGFCYTGFVTMDAEGRDLRDVSDVPTIHPDLFVSVFWANPVNGSTVMMPRAIFDEVGPFDETLRADVDGDMWLRVLKTRRARYLPGASLRYRIHDAALSADKPLMRASKSQVRRARLRDGSLVARLRASDPVRTWPAILARMSAQFTKISMPGRRPRAASCVVPRRASRGPTSDPATKAAVLAATTGTDQAPGRHGCGARPAALVRRVRRLGAARRRAALTHCWRGGLRQAAGGRGWLAGGRLARPHQDPVGDREVAAGRRGPPGSLARPAGDGRPAPDMLAKVREPALDRVGRHDRAGAHIDHRQPGGLERPPVLVERPGERCRAGPSRNGWGRLLQRRLGKQQVPAGGDRPGDVGGRGVETVIVEDVQQDVHGGHERVRAVRRDGAWLGDVAEPEGGRGILLAQALHRARGEVAAVDP